jgi:excisionase family DNA binding protein
MYNQSNPMYVISHDDLSTLLREIIHDEVSNVIDTKVIRQPKVLSRTEAAERLGICENTISKYVKQGRIQNRGIGRKLMLYDTDLEQIKTR